MNKIGRNDPCPCGSGNKYKNCCINKTSVQTGQAHSYATDPQWSKIRRTEGELIFKVLDFAINRFGSDLIESALEEFTIGGDYEINDIHRDEMFMPWLAFSYLSEVEVESDIEEDIDAEIDAKIDSEDHTDNGDESQDVESAMGEDQDEDEDEHDLIVLPPLAILYLDEYADKLSQYEQAFIFEACLQPHTFFVIDNVDPGKSMAIRDIYLGRKFTVKEPAASQALQRGDIIYSSVVELDGQAILLGLAPTMLPPQAHRDILDARDALKKELKSEGRKLDKEALLRYDIELRDLYFDLVDYLSTPRMPILQNTDGDPINFVKLYFKLHCAPRDAMEALKSLSLRDFREEILDDAIYDTGGNLVEVTITWNKAGNKLHEEWDNTILGTLKIQGDVLTAEVNSKKRAEKIKSEIAKRLKKRVSFERAVYESPEDKLEAYMEQLETPAGKEGKLKDEELQSNPEVQKIVKKHIEAHWEAWYNQRIPALNNKTPMQAARTPAGRERLEALLMEFERLNERAPDPNLRVDLAAIRRRLGL